MRNIKFRENFQFNNMDDGSSILIGIKSAKIFHLNATATTYCLSLERHKGEISFVIKEISDQFNIPAHQALADLQSLSAELAKHEFIEVAI